MKIVLLGHPVGHSRSRDLFEALARAGGPVISYEPHDVTSDALPDAIANLRAGVWDGANVTVPHKHAVTKLLNGMSPRAVAARAVNVIVRDGDDGLYGANTDGPGFLSALQHEPRALEVLNRAPTRAALILGSGGGGRAVASALSESGFHVLMVSRDVERDQERMGKTVRGVIGWDDPDLADIGSACAMVVQATSLGMEGTPLPAPPFPFEALHDGQVVVDLVYNPWQTHFLAEARARGAFALNGWPMLVHQATLACDHWLQEGAGDLMPRAAATIEPRDPGAAG